MTGFAVQNSALNAIGTLTATLTNAAGAVIGTTTQQVALPVAAAGSCQILSLTLGPLDLNLLGQQAAGNLLGNLLCAVANLLNSNGPLQGMLGSLATLLNQIPGAPWRRLIRRASAWRRRPLRFKPVGGPAYLPVR